MKILRFLAFTLGGLVAALAVLAVVGWVLVSSLDATAIKADITKIVREKKQRELRIEGELGLSFWPSIGVTIGRTTLSEAQSDKPFAALQSLHASLSILPLLKKELVISGLTVSGLSATVVKDKNGAFNFADLLTSDEASPMLHWDIQQVSLDNAQLGFRDLGTQRSFMLDEINLRTGQLAAQAAGTLQLDAYLNSPEFSTPITLHTDYRLDVPAQRVALSNMLLTLAGNASGIAALDASLAVKTLDVDGIQHNGTLDSLTLKLRGEHGASRFEVAADVPKVTLLSGRAVSDKIALAIKQSGQDPLARRLLEAKLDVTGIEATSETVSASKVAVLVDGRMGDATARAQFGATLQADWRVPNVQLNAISGQADLTHPGKLAKPMRLPISGKLYANFAQRKAFGELTTRLDESTAKVSWRADDLAPLALWFDAEIDQLNADKYLPTKPAPGKAGTPTAAPAFADTALPFDALKGLNLSGRVKIGQLQVARVKARDVKLELRAKDDTFELAPYSANLYQGTLTGSLRLAAANRQIAVKQNWNNVALGPLLKDAFDQDRLEGRGTLVLDVSSRGDNVATLKQALTGTARLELSDGVIKGIHLGRALRALKTDVSSPLPDSARTEKTVFSDITSQWRIQQGVARNDDLLIKAPTVRATGSGDVNLGKDQVDYLLRISLPAQGATPAGKEPTDNKALTLPVRVHGALASPSFQLDATLMAKDAAKGRVEEIKNTLRRDLKDAVRGALGR